MAAQGQGPPAGRRNVSFIQLSVQRETRTQALLSAQRRTAASEWLGKIPAWDWHRHALEIARSAAKV